VKTFFVVTVLSIIPYDYFHNAQLLRDTYRTPSRMIVVLALPACQKPGIETGTISVSSCFHAISKYDDKSLYLKAKIDVRIFFSILSIHFLILSYITLNFHSCFKTRFAEIMFFFFLYQYYIKFYSNSKSSLVCRWQSLTLVSACS